MRPEAWLPGWLETLGLDDYLAVALDDREPGLGIPCHAQGKRVGPIQDRAFAGLSDDGVLLVC